MANGKAMRIEEIEKRATRYVRKDFPSDENGDGLDKKERDY